jgi:Tol biopolymer transport system component
MRATSALKLTCLISGVGLAAAAPASAVVVYNDASDGISIAADDGAGARQLDGCADAAGRCYFPKVSPDGRTVVYIRDLSRSTSQLVRTPASGGSPRILVGQIDRGWSAFAWSPDSTTIAVVPGAGVPSKLLLINVDRGSKRVVAKGRFDGASFSPDGRKLVYARSKGKGGMDLYTTRVSGGRPRRLTHGGADFQPVWGKQLIVFSRKQGGKQQLSTVPPSGGRARALTHATLRGNDIGLVAVEWSADGSRLLANFVWRRGTNTHTQSAPATVDPRTGRVHVLSPRNLVSGARLSNDGSSILADGVDGVVTLPYAGGPQTTLAPNGADADWTR